MATHIVMADQPIRTTSARRDQRRHTVVVTYLTPYCVEASVELVATAAQLHQIAREIESNVPRQKEEAA